MATRRVKTKNRSQAYTGPSYKMPPWMKKKRGGKRGRGGRRGGKRGGRGGGRSGGRGDNNARKKKVPDAPAYLLEEKKKKKENALDKPKVGVVDVTVKLPSQFKKDEIFSLEMSKSNIAIISKLVADLQKLVKEEEDEKKIANDLDNVSKNSTKTLENQHETKHVAPFFATKLVVTSDSVKKNNFGLF